MKRILAIVLAVTTLLSITSFSVSANDYREFAVEDLKPQWPIKSERIFYLTGIDYYKSGGKHNGIDIGNNGGSTAEAMGENIYPVAEGIVSGAGYDNSMGYYVKITHTVNGKQYYSRYMHFLKDSIPSNIKKGVTVYKDTVIGRMGNTGQSGGTHLHFDIANTDSGSYEQLSKIRGYTFDYYINNPSSLKNVRFSASWDSNNGSKKSCYWNWIVANSERINGEYAIKSHTCPTELNKNNYATLNGILGACRGCGKAYNWQATFQKTTTQVYELKNSNKNDKVIVRSAPYEDAKEQSNRVNKKFTVVGTVTNAYGNKWYVVDYQDDVKKMCYTAYVYGKNIDDKYVMTSSTAEAKKYDSGNTSTKKHTHNYNYDNGRCYCGEQKQVIQQTYDESTLKINLTQYPSQHTQGNNFGLRGTISSNYKIKKIYGYIKQNGNVIQSTEDTPNSKSVDVKKQNLNNNLIFDRLSLGNYTLEVQAVDASGNSIRVSKDFTVVGKVVRAESTLSINLEKYPVTLNAGSGFGLRGSVNSNYDISVVRGYVINSNGQTVLSSKDTPYSSSLNIKSARLNNDLVFNNLSAGNYTLKIVATDTSGRTVEVSKGFSVVSPQKSNDSSLSINLDSYPVTLTLGTSYGLRGSITSNYDISLVRGYVINSNGQTVLSSKDTPYSTHMNIRYANLNEDLIFNNLSVGSYIMKVVAVDASGRTVEATKNFTVKAISSYVDDAPNGNGVTGIVDIPSNWENLSIRSGPSTNYQIVGSMNDGVKCTVYPNKTVNGWYYVNYNGIWGYASGNQININTSSDDTQTIVPVSPPVVQTSIRFELEAIPKGNMPYGKSFTLKGWFRSDSAIAEARAYILDANKNIVMQSGKASSTTSNYKIQGYMLDKAMKFNELSPGGYYLKYYVRDANGDTATWMSDMFYIVK